MTIRDLPVKACAVCGREIRWRKKWERDWDRVRYCSERCKRAKLDATDEALTAAIVELLERRGRGTSICPSEAARAVDPQAWRELMERARSAARRLVDAGVVEITQGGVVVDPSTATGPIRIRSVRRGG
ncbi:MAG: DUF2256 and DUF3253 domain-containing protein [Planctomycetota bacterium]